MTPFKASRYRPIPEDARVITVDPKEIDLYDRGKIWLSEDDEGYTPPSLPPKNADSIIRMLPTIETEAIRKYVEGQTQLEISAQFNVTQSAISHRMRRMRKRSEFLSALPEVYFNKEELERRTREALIPKTHESHWSMLEKYDVEIFLWYLETHNQLTVAKRLAKKYGIDFKQCSVHSRLTKQIARKLLAADRELYDIHQTFYKCKDHNIFGIENWWQNREDYVTPSIKDLEGIRERKQLEKELQQQKQEAREGHTRRLTGCIPAYYLEPGLRGSRNERLMNYEAEFIASLTPLMRKTLQDALTHGPRSKTAAGHSMLSHIEHGKRLEFMEKRRERELLKTLDIPPLAKKVWELKLAGLLQPKICSELKISSPMLRRCWRIAYTAIGKAKLAGSSIRASEVPNE